MSETSPATDESLAAAAASGERAAFETLVGRHAPGVRAVLAQALKDSHRVDDLVQEVWVKVFGALPRFRADGRFRPWLFSIALNHLRDELRRGRRGRLVYIDDYRTVEGQAGVELPDHSVSERKSRVAAALATIDQPFREAVALVDLGGLTYAEAAACMGCSVGTVKSRVFRGRDAFRRSWAATESEQDAQRTTRSPGVAP